jgi:sulfonate transport system substrate-binding protein
VRRSGNLGSWPRSFGRKKFAAVALAALFGGVFLATAHAADALREIHIDWATYNPVSMVLKEKGLLE